MTGLLRDPLDRWAVSRPSVVAMTFGSRDYTWSEFRSRVLRLTGALHAAGITAGSRVAVVDLNHIAVIELTLAASALGAATVPVNFRLTADQIGYILDDSRPAMLFHGAQFAASDSVPRCVVIDEEYETFLAAGQPDLGDASPDDVCLVMYTSGTTGHPKGAQLTHRGVTAHSTAGTTATGMTSEDVNLVAMPLFHVGGTSYTQVGLMAGARTVLLREPTPAAIFGAIADGATRAFFVPAVIYGVLAGGDAAITAFGKLRAVAYGASPMPLPMLRRTLDTWPTVEFTQVYGMTELSGLVTVLGPAAHRDLAHPERLASAGLPVPGVEARVVDPVTLTDVPVGVSGELWFRTSQVMHGYLNRPDATAETITADGWLRTGDIGRVDAGGFVYVLDRLKDMIITGGENVYGPEVESVLNACPGVAEGVIIGVPDEQWGEAIKAIVVAAPGVSLTSAEVITFCRERLAHYQCPTTVDFTDSLPRNATGKILKHVLRAPHWAAQSRPI